MKDQPIKASAVKTRLDKVLGANKEENVLKSLQKPWKEIESALEFAISSALKERKDVQRAVNKSWNRCLSLLAQKSWGVEDIEKFKNEWRGGILTGLNAVQGIKEKKDPDFWKPISKARKDINTALTPSQRR